MTYPNYDKAEILLHGFKYGFPIHYTGPRTPIDCKNLKSIYQNPHLALKKNYKVKLNWGE